MKQTLTIRGQDRARALASYGAHIQLDRAGAHRPKVVPNKKREAGRKACRGRWS